MHERPLRPFLWLPAQVIGVAQVINKNMGNGEFTKEDEEVRVSVCEKLAWW